MAFIANSIASCCRDMRICGAPSLCIATFARAMFAIAWLISARLPRASVTHPLRESTLGLELAMPWYIEYMILNGGDRIRKVQFRNAEHSVS